MRSTRKVNSGERLEALLRALMGVKDKREEAFILLTAVPEDDLPEVVRYLRKLNGLEDRSSPCTLN